MKRKNLFYVPGLISLLGLPLIFFFYPIEGQVSDVALTVRLPDDEKSPYGYYTFSK